MPSSVASIGTSNGLAYISLSLSFKLGSMRWPHSIASGSGMHATEFVDHPKYELQGVMESVVSTSLR